MRNFALPLVIVASLGLTSIAMAATTDSTATGAIKALDVKACTVTLDSDAIYKFKPKCDFSKLTVGEKVTVTYVTKGKDLDASTIVAATV